MKIKNNYFNNFKQNFSSQFFVFTFINYLYNMTFRFFLLSNKIRQTSKIFSSLLNSFFFFFHSTFFFLLILMILSYNFRDNFLHTKDRYRVQNFLSTPRGQHSTFYCSHFPLFVFQKAENIYVYIVMMRLRNWSFTIHTTYISTSIYLCILLPSARAVYKIFQCMYHPLFTH